MQPVSRALKIVLTNLLVGLALLVPIELYFGTWLAGQGGISRYDAQPNIVQRLESPAYPPGTVITYRRNKFGFRGGPMDPASIDVLAIGGSTTNERLLDEKDTWTAVLQRLLREQDCPVTIANAGIDGYSTAGNIASFEGWLNEIPGLKPRVVLVYVGINDASLDPQRVNLLESERYRSRWRQFQHLVAAHSALYRLFATVRGSIRARNARLLYNENPIHDAINWEPATLPVDFAAVVRQNVAAYRERLGELNARIHKFGAQPVYITEWRGDGRLVDGQWQQWQTPFRSAGAEETAMLEAINNETLAFCREHGETCIDAANRLGFTLSDLYDAVHTSPAGSARFARFLASRLAPLVCPGPTTARH
jgi:lysophospholipase L1-like esterase